MTNQEPQPETAVVSQHDDEMNRLYGADYMASTVCKCGDAKEPGHVCCKACTWGNDE
jgi:hypothetical protein